MDQDVAAIAPMPATPTAGPRPAGPGRRSSVQRAMSRATDSNPDCLGMLNLRARCMRGATENRGDLRALADSQHRFLTGIIGDVPGQNLRPGASLG
jgi:hypothetical protein